MITQQKRLDARDALASLLMILAEHHDLPVDPAKVLDFADRIVSPATPREDAEHLIDLFIGELRK